MTEPDVTLTDYLLAIESFLLAALLVAQPAGRPDLQRWFVVFFMATGMASVLGGTVHGFFVAQPSRAGRVLWRATLISIGIAAASGWMIGTALLWRDAHLNLIFWIVAAQLIGYAMVVVAINDAFWVAMVNYLPSTTFLIVAYSTTYRASPNGALTVGLAGLALTLVAGLVQRMRIALHPIYFNHNAVFHVLHGVSLFLIFSSGRHLIGR